MQTPTEAQPAGTPAPARAAPPPSPRPPRNPPPPEVETVAARPAPPSPAPPAPPAGLTAAQLAGAATAGSGLGTGSGGGQGAGSGTGSGAGGSGSGRCDMIGRIQQALREDSRMVAAAARAQSLLPSDRRALLVWDGDWVLNPGEAGRGLAGLRQAIAVEIAFAPAECRRQTERGLVLLTLADGPGAPRLALGTGSWRWSDLTGGR